MSRPVSAPRIRPTSAGKNGTQKNGVMSYEDTLVAQYLEELQRAPLRYSLTGTSPYSQRLGNTHVVPFSQTFQNGDKKPRPFSAVHPPRPQSGKQSKYGDGGAWENYSSRSNERKRHRPVSAPVYKTRPLSAATYSSMGSRPMSGKSVGSRRVKSLYKRQPHTIVVTAYRNGSKDTFARVVAPNLKMLLEICTEKLELGNAARRVFLGNGKEVYMAREIPRDGDIYVSMGEPFKNPYHSVKSHQEQQKSIAWTMHGLIWTSETKKKPAKTKLSKRFQSLIETSRRRVLVFKNGFGNDGIEVVADPERFEEFLSACTGKLSLTSYARVLFDWEGNPITDLKDAPMLDQCLQTWSTPVLGPLWVSKGEGFSPSGVNDFLQSMITYTKAKLSEAKEYLQELKKAKDDRKDEVNIAAILSMGDGEIDEALEIVDKDIEDFTNALNRLKGQMRKLQGEVEQEEVEKSNYKLSHIEQIDTEHRLVGSKGLRIKIFENGTYEESVILYFNLTQAMRGIGHDQKKLMERLLDQCSNSHYLNNPKTNTALKPVAQKLYDKFGKELKNVHNIEYDSEVWLSFGEPWKNPFTFVLTAMYDKVQGYEIQGNKRLAREQLMIEDVKGKESWTQWESFGQWPDDQNVRVFESGNPMDMGELDHVQGLLEMGELPLHASLLRHKEKQHLLLFGDITMDTKKSKGSTDLWPGDSQLWLITEDGYIRNKAFPRLVLGVSDSGVSCNLSHPLKGVQDTKVEGFLVWLMRKEEHATNQQWVFTTDGHICPRSHPEMALTYSGMRFGDEETSVENESDNALKGIKPYLAVCEKLEGKDAKYQRFGIKQERMDNFGQWKHTEVGNPEWNKKALSWPVNENGEMNEKFDWPMEGYIMPFAPPLKAEKKSNNFHVAPLRLTVLKNGVRDSTKAFQVVGPDLSNMKKDNKAKVKTKAKKKEIPDDDSLHEDMNVLKLEFQLFLERATGMLDLPFAARRMFDAEGKEHFTLQSLTRDQLVYVSCGEPWSDPNLSKAEQQRRYLLANLASDVSQMRQYMALRNPQTAAGRSATLPAISQSAVGKSARATAGVKPGGAKMKLPPVTGKKKTQVKARGGNTLPKVNSNQRSKSSLTGSRTSLTGSKSVSGSLDNVVDSNNATGEVGVAQSQDGVIEGQEGVNDDGDNDAEDGDYGADGVIAAASIEKDEWQNVEGVSYDPFASTDVNAESKTMESRDINNEADEPRNDDTNDNANEEDEEAEIAIRGYGDGLMEDTNREEEESYDPTTSNNLEADDGPNEEQHVEASVEYQQESAPQVAVDIDNEDSKNGMDNENEAEKHIEPHSEDGQGGNDHGVADPYLAATNDQSEQNLEQNGDNVVNENRNENSENPDDGYAEDEADSPVEGENRENQDNEDDNKETIDNRSDTGREGVNAHADYPTDEGSHVDQGNESNRFDWQNDAQNQQNGLHGNHQNEAEAHNEEPEMPRYEYEPNNEPDTYEESGYHDDFANYGEQNENEAQVDNTEMQQESQQMTENEQKSPRSRKTGQVSDDEEVEMMNGP